MNIFIGIIVGVVIIGIVAVVIVGLRFSRSGQGKLQPLNGASCRSKVSEERSCTLKQ